MRKLASVQYIHGIEPIEGADRIELVKVLGWQCIVPKGEFKVGDLCVYFEVDSFLPICDRFEFLRKSSYKKTDIMGEGFRLKTVKMRGQISQGLVQPLDILPFDVHGYMEKQADGKLVPCVNIGDDVTELLGVRKWEEEERVTDFGVTCGGFPSVYFEPTDEIRCQAVPAVLDEFRGREVYITTKMDGTSVSVYRLGDHFGVCGRNYEYSEGKLVDFMKGLGLGPDTMPDGMMIQGEFCGAGIQKNRLKLKRPEWYVFTIQYKGERLGLKEMLVWCEKLGLEHVPVEEVTGFCYSSVAELLERARGKYPSGMDKEGIVIRPVVPVKSEALGGWLSIKAINNDYLLKE